MATIMPTRKVKVKKARRLDDPEEIKRASVGYKAPKAKVKVKAPQKEMAKKPEVSLEEQAANLAGDLNVQDIPASKKARVTQPGQALEPTLSKLQLEEQAASIGEDLPVTEEVDKVIRAAKIQDTKVEGDKTKKRVKIKRKKY